MNLYRHFDKKGTLLYVGVSLNPIHRTQTHVFVSEWAKLISKITIEKCRTRASALRKEAAAIRNENPIHNKAHKKKIVKQEPIRIFPVDFFKKWGRKGGKRRAEVLTPERRSAIAKKAGKARGKKK
jgi:hypothetical protein